MKQDNDQTIAHQTADVVDNVADGIRSAAQSVGGSVLSTAHAVHDAAGHAAGAVRNSLEDVGQYARNSFNRTRAKARSVEKSFERSVRDHPKTAVLLGAALGAGIVIWWTRKGR
jgi:ElaB/YqjD/DUF883 family membrane-anchored ribosome-binding protein